MKGRVKGILRGPSGVIQEYADDVRLGIMKFNDRGDHSECQDPKDVGLFANCEQMLQPLMVLLWQCPLICGMASSTRPKR